jgi:hypothetical protein
MTVAANTSSIKLISGSGWSSPLTHNAYLEDQTFLEVWADGVQLTIGTEYTVSGVADPVGYEVTIVTPGDWDPTTWVLMVRTPSSQPTDLSAGGTLGTIYETSLDKMARRLKTVEADVSRAIKRRYDYSASVPDFVDDAYAENSVLKVNAAGDIVEGPLVAEIEAVADEAAAAAASAVAAAASAVTASDAATAAGTAQSNAESAETAAAASAASIGFTLDTDGTMAANSNAVVPSQAAVVTYVAANGGIGDMVFADDVLDEDNMASNSDVDVPTQQSVKAYVDAAISAILNGVAAAGDTLAELYTLITTHTALTNNPHSVTAAQLGVGSSDSPTFVQPTVKAVTETRYALSGTTPAVDPANGGIQTWTLSGASTPTDSLGDGESVTLHISDGTANTVTWTSLVDEWIGGAAPTLPTTGYAVIEVWKVNTTVYAAYLGDLS